MTSFSDLNTVAHIDESHQWNEQNRMENLNMNITRTFSSETATKCVATCTKGNFTFRRKIIDPSNKHIVIISDENELLHCIVCVFQEYQLRIFPSKYYNNKCYSNSKHLSLPTLNDPMNKTTRKKINKFKLTSWRKKSLEKLRDSFAISFQAPRDSISQCAECACFVCFF